MSVYALYRLPYADYCVRVEQTEGKLRLLHDCEELNDCKGFVVAPFHVTDSQPILLIRPDKTTQLPLVKPTSRKGISGTMLFDKGKYVKCFEKILSLLQEDSMRKIVLARSAVLPNCQDASPEELFWRACKQYPRMFISLVSMPDGTFWLTATPEILLEGKGLEWRTIALAGTMQLEGEELQGEGENIRWSPKNIQEQRYVASYIANCLDRFSLTYKEDGPKTVRAAHLVHLRSDFTFTLHNNMCVGNMLKALHPTPAVCGLPRQMTFDFIINHEQVDRQYYSGFMGPLNMDNETHLYVSLRCMHITASDFRLYAGGGILKDSVMEQEWQETEAKMQTMLNLF